MKKVELDVGIDRWMKLWYLEYEDSVVKLEESCLLRVGVVVELE